MPNPDWNSAGDPGGIANNRPPGFAASGDRANQAYEVVHGRILLFGGSVLSVGDVWQFNGTTNDYLTTGSSYTVLAISLYQHLLPTVNDTLLNAPDNVVLTGNLIVPVDYLYKYFTRTSHTDTSSPYGHQFPWRAS